MESRLEAALAHVRRGAPDWSIAADGASAIVHPRSDDERVARCSLLLYLTAEGRLGAFFFKRSLLPYSRNRYSYGHVVCTGEAGSEEMVGWLDYVRAAFHADARPARLRRAAPASIPA